MPSSTNTPDLIERQSCIEPEGWFDRSSRVRLEIAGSDRAKFLHNLTTNDVKRLAEGAGQESFVTSPQGKVLAYVTLLASKAAILLRTDPDSLDLLLPHLNKYGVFDEVAIEDISSRTFEIHVVSPSLKSIFETMKVELPPEGALRHRSAELAGTEVRMVRESPTGRAGLTLIGPIEGSDRVWSALIEGGLPELDSSVYESLRIEAGTPISGQDVTSGHLPQEVGRDALTINFVKGCYLGQETVARLDALGHVNRIFKGLRIEGESLPPAGSPLTYEGKVVGSITSASHSPVWGSPVALGYVRVAQAIAGTRLVAMIEGIGEVEAIVADLPMLPPVSG